MAYKIIILSCFICVSVLSVSCAQCATVSSKELIEKAINYDGKTVTYSGEAVGAVMKTGNSGWVNLNDGVNAIGVWGDRALLSPIDNVGNYKGAGDMVEVIGIFNRACKIHKGELDIHAISLKVVSEGLRFKHKLDHHRLVASNVLFLAIIGIAVFFRKRF